MENSRREMMAGACAAAAMTFAPAALVAREPSQRYPDRAVQSLRPSTNTGSRFVEGLAMRHHHEGDLGHLGDDGEILYRIVRQRLEGVGVGHQRRRARKEERVAVGRRARCRLCADNVSAAWPVLDYNLLADRARQLLGDEAADDVRGHGHCNERQPERGGALTPS
jgi:hypothetical protein